MSRQLMPTDVDGKVFVLLTAEEARVLARVLMHYDALTDPDGPHGNPLADGYDHDVWNTIAITLFQQAEQVDTDELLAAAAASPAADVVWGESL